jgi:ChpA-C
MNQPGGVQLKGLGFHMHYSTRRHVALGLTTGGLLMTGLGMTSAHADTGATASGDTAGSPGVASGNLLEIPINLPVNICGNQVGVIGILDTVAGNDCANSGGGASASGSSHGSPGVGSGNLIQIPINAPINICGNQLDVIGIGNNDRGNSCKNSGKGSGTSASGSGSNSPGIGAGNVLQVPVNAPVNVCGNQVNVVGILDSVTGNSCKNGSEGGPGPHPTPTPTPTPTSTSPTPTPSPTGCTCPPPPPPTTPCPPTSAAPSSSSPTRHHHPHPHHTPTGRSSLSASATAGQPSGVLAHTGTDALAFAPFGAGLFGGGVVLRRRFPTRRH